MILQYEAVSDGESTYQNDVLKGTVISYMIRENKYQYEYSDYDFDRDSGTITFYPSLNTAERLVFYYH